MILGNKSFWPQFLRETFTIDANAALRKAANFVGYKDLKSSTFDHKKHHTE